jgi:hypothetical protein
MPTFVTAESLTPLCRYANFEKKLSGVIDTIQHCLKKKTRGRKSRVRVPLSQTLHFNYHVHYFRNIRQKYKTFVNTFCKNFPQKHLNQMPQHDNNKLSCYVKHLYLLKLL